MKNFAERLVYYRTVRGLSQIELAEKCGLNNATISRIEANQRLPRQNTVNLLCHKLELPREEWDVMLDLAGFRAASLHSLMNLPELGLLDDIYPRLEENTKGEFLEWLEEGLETWRGKL